MKALFVAWQEPETRRWFPVGRRTHEYGKYKFVYTKGAKDDNEQTWSNFRPIEGVCS